MSVRAPGFLLGALVLNTSGSKRLKGMTPIRHRCHTLAIGSFEIAMPAVSGFRTVEFYRAS